MKTNFDLAITVIFLFFAYRGYRRGIIEEFGKLISFFAGILLAGKHYQKGAELIQNYFELQPDISTVVGFVVVLIMVIITMQILFFSLRKLIHILMLGWMDRILGLVFGFLKAAILLSIFLWILSVFPEIRMVEEIKKESWSYRMVDNFKNNLIDTFNLNDRLDNLKKEIHDFVIRKKELQEKIPETLQP